jgi:hypothetical protein
MPVKGSISIGDHSGDSLEIAFRKTLLVWRTAEGQGLPLFQGNKPKAVSVQLNSVEFLVRAREWPKLASISLLCQLEKG